VSDVQKLIADTKQWLEQEKVWDDQIYCSKENKAVIASEAKQSVSTGQTASSGRHTSGNPPRNDGMKADALKTLYEKYKDCQRCPLGATRIKFVFGVGNPDSEVLFIGEGPGYEEDRRGAPFVGKAGLLLDKMIAAIGLSRQTNAYIANIVKCHAMANPQTPDARNNDRPPSPEEVEACSPILLQQIAIMKPRVIMTLGSPSTKMILHTKEGITGLRGKLVPFDVEYFYPASVLEEVALFEEEAGKLAESKAVKIDAETRQALGSTQVLPTYHPAALLRNPNLKPESWTDLKLLRDTLAKP
jgi:DNA polymerase